MVRQQFHAVGQLDWQRNGTSAFSINGVKSMDGYDEEDDGDK